MLYFNRWHAVVNYTMITELSPLNIVAVADVDGLCEEHPLVGDGVQLQRYDHAVFVVIGCFNAAICKRKGRVIDVRPMWGVQYGMV